MFHRVVAAVAFCAAFFVAGTDACELGYGPPECSEQKWCDKFRPYEYPDNCKEFPPGFLCGDELEFRCAMCFAMARHAYCTDPAPNHIWRPDLHQKVCKDGGSLSYLAYGSCARPGL
ncbi:hypothetical protein AAVH_36787 [Aphelenchoides avenae]|nr:hypothetical protein AAVH_36787 [Aphelenchus avenae]